MILCKEHIILSYIDLIDIGKEINKDSEHAVELMQTFHMEVNAAMQSLKLMENHSHAYVWNDSVLLVAYSDNDCFNAEVIVKEVCALKRRIDRTTRSFAVMVKGMNFKEPSDYTGAQYIAPIGEQPRFVYLKASSYAFANCFEIEKKLGKKFKKEWYIDQHIFNKMNATVNYQSESFEMLPTNEKRQIFMFDGYPY